MEGRPKKVTLVSLIRIILILIFLYAGLASAKPIATILTPVSGGFYRGGDTIHLSGSGYDAIDGELPPSAFTWLVNFHHNTHIHDGPPILRNAKEGIFVIPTGGELSAVVYYSFVLIVKNSNNESDTTYSDVFPKKSTISVNSVPPGLNIRFDGSNMPMPVEKETVQNLDWYMIVDSLQTLNGKDYTFDHWSNGIHTSDQSFSVPENDTTFTVYFTLLTELDDIRYSNNEVQLFPNPAKDFVNIKYTGGEKYITLVIFDVLSQEKKRIDKLIFQNGDIKINIEDLLPGIYFLKVSTEIKETIIKFLIE